MVLTWILYLAAAIALLGVAGLCLKLWQFFGSLQQNIDGVSGEVKKTVETVNAQIGSIQGQVDQIMKNVAGISGQGEETLSRVNTSIDRVNAQLVEVQGIVSSLKEISGDAERMTEDVADVLHETRNVVVSLIDLEQDIQRKVSLPVTEFMSVFSAVGRGIRVFRHRMGEDGATVRRYQTAYDESTDDVESIDEEESEERSGAEVRAAAAGERFTPPAGVPNRREQEAERHELAE